MHTCSFAQIDYPQPLREAVENAVTSWKNFCSLPLEEKMAFVFLEDGHGDGGGYEFKQGRDSKENFHITLFQHERLTKIRTFSFLSDAKTLLDRMEPLILQFAKNLEEEYHLAGLVDETKSCKPFWTLRYLHYFGDKKKGEEIAAPHIDKGGFTLHLFESDAGLQHYSLQDHTWKEIPVGKNETVIFLAAQLQFWSKGNLKALYHRVVATEKTAEIGRFSMVCFVPFQKGMYNKREYGSMQTHEVGFNYALPHEEFAKLFA